MISPESLNKAPALRRLFVPNPAMPPRQIHMQRSTLAQPRRDLAPVYAEHVACEIEDRTSAGAPHPGQLRLPVSKRG
jgi:hypothetical protein